MICISIHIDLLFIHKMSNAWNVIWRIFEKLIRKMFHWIWNPNWIIVMIVIVGNNNDDNINDKHTHTHNNVWRSNNSWHSWVWFQKGSHGLENQHKYRIVLFDSKKVKHLKISKWKIRLKQMDFMQRQMIFFFVFFCYPNRNGHGILLTIGFDTFINIINYLYSQPRILLFVYHLS